MEKQDVKYLIAYLGPAATVAGLWLGGGWSLGIVYVAFGVIPLLEFVFPQRTDNAAPDAENERSHTRFFDFLLYLHVPILYGILIYAFYLVGNQRLTMFETFCLVANVGTLVGAFGINVGHELGHRATAFEQSLSKILLLPALYQHFFIEHNRGHHKNVATDADPASARLNEPLYAFWLRSVRDSYRNAWQLERERLARAHEQFFSWKNEMIRFSVYQIGYLAAVGVAYGYPSVFVAVGVAAVGFLLLETVNYIEHYGLRRKILPNGRPEPVLPQHSWNSNHDIGRIFLYELTRHSDHHFKATRKYQILRHFDESPQLPLGYPMSMLVSLVPPLWFRLMNGRVPIGNLQ